MLDLLLCNKYSLSQLQYHHDDCRYTVAKSLKLSLIRSSGTDSSITHILQSKSTIFVIAPANPKPRNRGAERGAAQVKILALTSELTIREERAFSETNSSNVVGAVVHQDHLIVSTNGKLLVLDQNLNTIGELSLLGIKKNADHILVNENIAYLLDDVREPLAVFKVNLNQLNQPKILEAGYIETVNGRLTGQWLEPSLKFWYILEGYARQGESGTSIHVLPMDGFMQSLSEQNMGWESNWESLNEPESGSNNPYHIMTVAPPVQSRSKQSIYSSNWGWADPGSESGCNILAVTPLPPIWALVQDADQNLYLSQLCPNNRSETRFGEAKIYCTTTFNHCLELSALLPTNAPPRGQRQGDEFWQYSGTIKYVDHHLFILFNSIYGTGWKGTSFQDSRLVVLNTQGEPQLVLNQDCPVKQAYPLLECIERKQ